MQVDDVFAARPTKSTIPVTPLSASATKAALKKLPAGQRGWAETQGFEGKPGQVCALPAKDGKVGRVLVGVDDGNEPWCFAALAEQLPTGRYRFDGLDDKDGTRAALAWALASYRFDRYRSSRDDPPKKQATLVWPTGADAGEVRRLAASTWLVRDLINTPAGDLGPAELAGAAEEIAGRFQAKCRVIVGDGLLRQNYPAVHAVGRASSREPRLVDLTWGNPKAPKLTLVGKGVVFDSGGLDLKPSSGMLLMKKDMGGAAHVLGLASAIMDAGLDVRLRVLVPCVENAVSGNAFRPLDVLQTRKGLTVEVGNTDAEGRLILCDALHEGASEEPAMMVDFATLTGAARVALGTSLPALFCNDDAMADAFLAGGLRAGDPVWRLPLHTPYRRMLDSPVADLNNVSSGGYAGAITAALFLKEFVPQGTPWAHIDVMAWNVDNQPGRPRGGEAMGMRAAYAMIRERFAER